MKKYLNNICLVLSVMLYFLYTMKDSMAYFVAGTLFAIPGTIGLFSSKSNSLKIFTVLVLIGSFLNMMTTSYGIGGSLIFLFTCGITFSCLKHLKLFFAISLILCIWLVVFLYYQMLVLGTVNGDIFLDYGLSKNYPGSMLVIFNCLWAAWKHMHYNKMPLLLPILSTIMAFFLDGRSSLICMVLITVFCFVVRGKKMTLVMLAVFIALLTHFWSDIMDYYEMSTVYTRGMETDRSIIWKAYFNNLDFSTVIFGLDTDHLPVIKEWGGNPHNSYLSFHRRMGIIGLGSLVFFLFKGFCETVKRKQVIVAFFFVVLLVRMFFDGMLTTAQDFFILTLIFIPLCYNCDEFRIEKQVEAKSDNKLEKLWDKFVFII